MNVGCALAIDAFNLMALCTACNREDTPVPNDGTVVHLREDEHFHSAERKRKEFKSAARARISFAESDGIDEYDKVCLRAAGCTEASIKQRGAISGHTIEKANIRPCARRGECRRPTSSIIEEASEYP